MRVVLKMSGEALLGEEGVIDADRLDEFVSQVVEGLSNRAGLEVALVLGGGNILRGKDLRGVARVAADQMGMLATIINALAVQSSLTRHHVASRVMTGIEARGVAEPYIHGRAIRHLEKGRVVVFAGGTGNPFFTTDMAAALRAREIDADLLLVAKSGTDGVCDKDPKTNPDARLYRTVSYETVLGRNLEVMDMSAIQMCREHELPIFVFNTEMAGVLKDALTGVDVLGSWVKYGPDVFAEEL
jgi:uridylate kinase